MGLLLEPGNLNPRDAVTGPGGRQTEQRNAGEGGNSEMRKWKKKENFPKIMAKPANSSRAWCSQNIRCRAKCTKSTDKNKKRSKGLGRSRESGSHRNGGYGRSEYV